MKNKHRHNEDGTTTIFVESKKYGVKETLIDTEDWEKAKDYRWHAQRARQGISAIKAHAPRRLNGKRAKLHLHHLVLGKPAKGCVTDHIDGDPLNNCKSNLRHVTRVENSQNRKLSSNNTSGFKGVCWGNSRKKKWRACIGMGTSISKLIGYYNTKEEAAEAYDKAVAENRQIVNAERQLNFPERLQEYLNEREVVTGGA